VCSDPSIVLLDEMIYREAIIDSRKALIRKAAERMLWAFGYDWDTDMVDQWFSHVWRD
jgi:hypothetical protein